MSFRELLKEKVNLSELKDSYYGVGDNIHNLVDELTAVIKSGDKIDGVDLKSELKNVKLAVKAYDAMKLGKKL